MKFKNRILEIGLGDAFVFLFAFFCFSTTCYRLVSFIPLNRLLAVPILMALVVIYWKTLKKWDVVLLFYLLFVAVYTIYVAAEIGLNISDYIYWITTILLFWKFGEEKVHREIFDAFQRNKKLLWYMTLGIEILLLLSFFDDRSYVRTNTWGEESYFVGFGKTSHSFASGNCLLLNLLIALQWNEKIDIRKILLLLLPIYNILQTGARVFLIPAAISLLIYYLKVQWKPFLKLVVLVICCMVAFWAYTRTNAYNKMENTMNNQYLDTPLNALTNGRIGFWTADLEAYGELPAAKKLLGNGFDYVYEVNYKSIRMSIWAHNDVIDSLLSVGVLGTIIYVVIFIKYIKDVAREFGRDRRYIEVSLLAAYIFLPLLLNGLFQYQHLIYSILLIALFNRQISPPPLSNSVGGGYEL